MVNKLSEILKVNRIWDVVVVGAGDIGHAVANYQGFTDRGFRVAGIFDNDKAKVGKSIGKFVVEDTETMAERISSPSQRPRSLTYTS